MLFSFYEVLLLIGVAQGGFTALLLLTSDKNRLSNRLLALGLVGFSIICLKTVLHSSGLTQTVLWRYIPIATELSVAPLFYLYMMSLIRPDFRFEKRMLWHLVPFFVIQFYVIAVYFSVVDITAFSDKDLVAGALYYQPVKLVEDYLTVVSIILYTLVGYRNVANYRKRVEDNISDNNYTTFNWLVRICQLGSAVGVFLFINLLMDALIDLNHKTPVHWQCFILYNAALVYYFGFVGYRQPQIKHPAKEALIKISEIDKLPNKQVERICRDLNRALHVDKIYLDPVISSQQLAKLLKISQSNLSFVVNNHFNKSFRELINELRINEVKSRLLDNEYSRHSILSIALDSGFNSEASFYRIFKNHTGLSPKAFVASQRVDSEPEFIVPKPCMQNRLTT